MQYPEYTDETRIYLLMSQNLKRARGFRDRKQHFTFAFTTTDKAEEFLRNARRIGMLVDVDMLFESTCGEFFEWCDQGKAKGKLTIDPDPAILEHSFFAGQCFKHN